MAKLVYLLVLCFILGSCFIGFAVSDLPTKPEIDNFETHPILGSMYTFTCKSSKSLVSSPSINLTWYINSDLYLSASLTPYSVFFQYDLTVEITNRSMVGYEFMCVAGNINGQLASDKKQFTDVYHRPVVEEITPSAPFFIKNTTGVWTIAIEKVYPFFGEGAKWYLNDELIDTTFYGSPLQNTDMTFNTSTTFSRDVLRTDYGKDLKVDINHATVSDPIKRYITLGTRSSFNLTADPQPALQGTSVELRCAADKDLTRNNLIWRRQGLTVATINSITSTSCIDSVDSNINYTYRCEPPWVFYLTIPSVTLNEQEVSWTCQDAHGFGSASATLNIVVAVPFVNIISPSQDTVTVALGNNQNFVCQTGESKPVSRIEWYIDGQKAVFQDSYVASSVSVSDKGLLITTSSVTIPGIQDYKSVPVMCMATNNYTTVPVQSEEKILIVQWPPEGQLEIIGNNQSEWYIDDFVTLQCRQKGGNPLATLTWKGICEEMFSTIMSTEIESVSEIVIRMNSSYNNQTCTCQSLHPQGSTNQTSTRFKVNYPPILRVDVTNSTEGATVTLTCTGQGEPNNITYLSWEHFKYNTLIRSEDDFSGISADKQSITFDDLSFEDGGTYRCQATNSIKDRQGNAIQFADAYFDVKVAAKFNKSQRLHDFHGELGKPVQIQIPFYSNPKVEDIDDVVWKYQHTEQVIQTSQDISFDLIRSTITLNVFGKEVKIDSQIAVMNIDHLLPGQIGTYSITITNDEGRLTSDSLFWIHSSEKTTLGNEDNEYFQPTYLVIGAGALFAAGLSLFIAALIVCKCKKTKSNIPVESVQLDNATLPGEQGGFNVMDHYDELEPQPLPVSHNQIEGRLTDHSISQRTTYEQLQPRPPPPVYDQTHKNDNESNSQPERLNYEQLQDRSPPDTYDQTHPKTYDIDDRNRSERSNYEKLGPPSPPAVYEETMPGTNANETNDLLQSYEQLKARSPPAVYDQTNPHQIENEIRNPAERYNYEKLGPPSPPAVYDETKPGTNANETNDPLQSYEQLKARSPPAVYDQTNPHQIENEIRKPTERSNYEKLGPLSPPAVYDETKPGANGKYFSDMNNSLQRHINEQLKARPPPAIYDQTNPHSIGKIEKGENENIN